MVGYPIPRSDGEIEAFWDPILIKRSLLTQGNLRRGKTRRIQDCLLKIERGDSKNASYHRMFGCRGGLGAQLRTQSILIIGTGALGSRLASLLVKGGVRKLGLMDDDSVEPGNLCRGEFRLEQVNLRKTKALHENLSQISPYVEIEQHQQLTFVEVEHSSRVTQESQLAQYDLIFDCTANFTLSRYLDQLTGRLRIFNLSISAGAEELVCAVGKPMTSELKDIFDRTLGRPWADGEVWEGAGCTSLSYL